MAFSWGEALNASWWIFPLLLAIVFFLMAYKKTPKGYECLMLIFATVSFFIAICGIFLTDKFTDLGTANVVNLVLGTIGLVFLATATRLYLRKAKKGDRIIMYIFAIIGFGLIIIALILDGLNVEFTLSDSIKNYLI